MPRTVADLKKRGGKYPPQEQEHDELGKIYDAFDDCFSRL